MAGHDLPEHPEETGLVRRAMDRRAFLRLLGGAAGTAALAGCGGGAYVLPPPQERPRRSPAGVEILPRGAWTRSGVCRARLNRMNGIGRITVHHEGRPGGTWATDRDEIVWTLRQIQRFQMTRRRMGDIAYHYIVDRAGRVWEGRSVAWQGAHVRDHNAHNIGVMLMGNFDVQKPASAQLASLERLLAMLHGRHRVPVRRIHTHRELVITRCPGRNLQPRIEGIRRHLV